jgi:tRNA (adenine57-N1/adenine58-N1)-methyltransferase catalytic subunit
VSATFEVGERALLLDIKRRRYLVELKAGGEFHSHHGFVPHLDIVGAPEGVVVRSTKGAEYTVLRPTLEDFVVEMPRGAQVIYPKDLAPICMLADIGPGTRVFESGVGSGALSMTMLRWGADIVGYEIRDDFANRARSNVRSFLGSDALARYDVRSASSYDGIDPADGPFDRVVLDLPEPWQVVPHAETVLRAGGILVAYTPSITQAAQTREQLRGRWIDARTLEVMHRGWHIEGQAVRPDHRMVAHTGFLSVARFLGKGSRNPAASKEHEPPMAEAPVASVDATSGAEGSAATRHRAGDQTSNAPTQGEPAQSNYGSM